MEAGVVGKIERSHGKRRDDPGGDTEKGNECFVVKNSGDEWDAEIKDKCQRSDGDALQNDRLSFDHADHFGISFKIFAQIFAHGSRDAIADQNYHHSGERND